MIIVTWTDASATVDVTVYSELYDANNGCSRKTNSWRCRANIEDRFSGGLRITADKAMDIAGARAMFVKALKLTMNGNAERANCAS